MLTHRLRAGFAEFKVNMTRLMTYLNIFNFLMILFIFLNTTLWEVTFFRNIIPDKGMFMLGGLISAAFISVVIAVLDKWYVHGEEIAKQLTLQRNPTISYECCKTAFAVSQAKKAKPDDPDVKWMEEWELQNFERLGVGEYFKRCLRAFE